ncbi:MAG: molybdopterin-dependent oxidoreductase [Actinomycetota bacterium]|nr:molybdopterin-dependent oxidoreductase [Actinomycetota bacterium]
MITVTIDGRKIELEKPVTILEAARGAGIEIPTLCSHPSLELWGGCRLCVVEVEKMPRLQTSCTVSVADGMVVRTETPQVAQARKAMLEFLLINHPLECPVCDKAGECKLQDLTVKYGAAAGRFEEGKRAYPENTDDPIIVRNMQRCILCTRCVRMCEGVQGAYAISAVGRGNKSYIEPFSGGRYDCEYCGNCLSVCPVGSIMSRLHRYSYRPWQMDRKVNTICSWCGVGCTLALEVRDEEIKRVTPDFGAGVNKGLLCCRGRFGYDYVASPQRLAKPLLRNKCGELDPAGWEEAYDFIAGNLAKITREHGPQSVGAIVGGGCTNEDGYLLQKIMRGLGSNNIDSISRLGLLPVQQIIEQALGPGATANLMEGIKISGAVLTVGGDPTSFNPVLGLQARAASRLNKPVITIGYAPGMKRHRSLSLNCAPGQEGVVLAGLLKEIFNIRPVTGDNNSLGEAIGRWQDILPSAGKVSELSGAAALDIKSAAKILAETHNPSIIAGRELASYGMGKANALLLAAIAYMLHAKVFLMSELSNEQGLADVGCAPELLPGGGSNSEKGLTLMEMIEAAASGGLKALWILGENPVFSLPGGDAVTQALKKLDLLIVQDIFHTETSGLAHAVLPASGWAETEGTYTNLEKRIQLLKKAIIKADRPENWRVLAGVGSRLSLDMAYNKTSDIMDEIAKVSSVHAGLAYKDIENGPVWPYNGKPPVMRRTPALFENSRDLINQMINDADAQKRLPGFRLALHRPLAHNGYMGRNSRALLKIDGGPRAILSNGDAERLGLEKGQVAKVSGANGAFKFKVELCADVPEGVIYASNVFKGAGAMGLAGYRLDPETMIPIAVADGLKVEKA